MALCSVESWGKVDVCCVYVRLAYLARRNIALSCWIACEFLCLGGSLLVNCATHCVTTSCSSANVVTVFEYRFSILGRQYCKGRSADSLMDRSGSLACKRLLCCCVSTQFMYVLFSTCLYRLKTVLVLFPISILKKITWNFIRCPPFCLPNVSFCSLSVTFFYHLLSSLELRLSSFSQYLCQDRGSWAFFENDAISQSSVLTVPNLSDMSQFWGWLDMHLFLTLPVSLSAGFLDWTALQLPHRFIVVTSTFS